MAYGFTICRGVGAWALRSGQRNPRAQKCERVFEWVLRLLSALPEVFQNTLNIVGIGAFQNGVNTGFEPLDQ